MAKKPQQREFEFLPWDTSDPCEKYAQPKPNDVEVGSGYPQTGMNKDNVLVKGRWPSGTGQKEHIDMRGYGAATKGRKFMVNNKKFSVEE